MAAFTLDTSGAVRLPNASTGGADRVEWQTLDAFTQGYIEALFASLRITTLDAEGSAAFVGALIDPAEPNEALVAASQRYREALCKQKACGIYPTPVLVTEPGFSDLAPESLARIIANCAALQAGSPEGDDEDGDHAWKVRQAGRWPDFPPLTVTLGDDGKVRFAEAS